MKALKGIVMVLVALVAMALPVVAEQSQSATTNPAWLELYHRLHEECVVQRHSTEQSVAA
jgi:hypothetical protein